MAHISAQVAVIDTPTLLWQTTTGVPPDPAVDSDGQVFRAGTFNDPLPVVIQNPSEADSVWLGGSTVTAETGTELPFGASLSFNVVGNDSLYAVSAGSVVVGVLVGRQ